jgi:hypothetical protein
MGARTAIRGRSRARRFAACFALAVLGSLAVASPLAFAGDYTVNVCTRSPDGGNGDGIALFFDPGTVGFGGRAACNRIPAEIELTARGASVTGASRWALSAPPGTFIRTLSGIREQVVTWDSPDVVWEIRNSRDRLERISSTAPGGPLTYTVNSDLVFAGLVCARPPCLAPDGSFDTSIAFENLVATLADEFPPLVLIPSTQPVLATVRGTVEIPFIASDHGSGIAAVRLFVDGEFVSSIVDSNDGKCVPPFRFLVPCRFALISSIPLDTTALSEGRHEVKVEVEDASRQFAESETISIDVRNAPDPVGPPSPNANPPLMADRTAPALSGASLSRKRFRVGKARTALIARATAPSGTVLRFSSSEAGTLSITIAKARKGVKPIATLKRSISAGRGKVPLSGRIGNKPLRPGRYRLTLSARDAAGNASAPVALPFRILSPAG